MASLKSIFRYSMFDSPFFPFKKKHIFLDNVHYKNTTTSFEFIIFFTFQNIPFKNTFSTL